MTQEFISACKKIESSKNYRPNITNQDLIYLVMNEDGTPKYSWHTKALAIQNFPEHFSDTVRKRYQIKIAMYQVKIAMRGIVDVNKSEYPEWHIDDETIILVNTTGKYSFHSKTNVESDNFNLPITKSNIEDYLGDDESLTYKYALTLTPKQKEMVKNPSVIGQAGLFAKSSNKKESFPESRKKILSNSCQ